MLDLDHLLALHDHLRLRLATTVGKQGFVGLDDDPDAMVRELIRLARLGQRVELEGLTAGAGHVRLLSTHASAWR